MSIRKLLGTGACMVIIGVSAGVSYGQFQRLTAHVVTSEPVIVASANAETATVGPSTRADFVTASVTTWTPAPASDVAQPQLVKPVVQTQPEPPLLQFTAQTPSANVAVTPTLAPSDMAETNMPTIATGVVPTQTAAALRKPIQAPRGVELAATPKTVMPTPAQVRRARLQSVATTSGGDDGIFEQQFPPRNALKPRRPSALSAGTRAAQRAARFERIWVTGVYR